MLPAADRMRWILYDIGGVLEIVDDDRWSQQLQASWRDRLGISAADYETRLSHARLPDITVRSGVAEEYWRGFGTALGVSAEALTVMRAEMWDAYCGRANTDLLEHARTLGRRAGRAILSNSADGAREEEELRYGFSAIFDPICYSHELGVVKPDPEAYRRALEEMGATAGQVLFIDDHAFAVQGAERCGIRTVLHRDNATTIAAIEEFLAS